MNDLDVIIAVYGDHQQAETAIKELERAGFDMKKLSVVGKELHPEEHVVGFYTVGDRAWTWGKFGALWGAVGGFLYGSGFFFFPGVGFVMLGGPIVSICVAALKAAAIVGGLSAFGGALYSLGVPNDSIIKYERALKSDKFLLMMHGTADELEKAKALIDKGGAEEATLHRQAAAHH